MRRGGRATRRVGAGALRATSRVLLRPAPSAMPGGAAHLLAAQGALGREQVVRELTRTRGKDACATVRPGGYSSAAQPRLTDDTATHTPRGARARTDARPLPALARAQHTPG